MAYFSNSTDGSCFDAQCAKCIFGRAACPIALVQSVYNYDACNNEVATNILNALVHNDGTCTMYREFKDTLDRGDSDSQYDLWPD